MKTISLVTICVLFSTTIGFSQITDIKSFLNQCPTTDPNINIILADFEIRLNGVLVTEFPCSEPVQAMPVADYTNPLIYLQTLRVIYYMDRYLPADHLPWTERNLYDWMKDNVDGINIVDGVSGGYCCDFIDGKKFFVTGNQDASNREFDKKWIGISGNVDFFAHEVRHADPGVYYHSSCCGITNGCDDTYDENDLGAYGVQYWLEKSWLSGFIYVGAKISHTPAQITEIINWHLNSLNYSTRTRFCNNIPAIVNLSDIAHPLGEIAILTTLDMTDISGSTATSGGNITFDNSVPITERGICWSTLPKPNISDYTTYCGTGNGFFECDLTGLMPNTKYYVRAFATNLFGTAYGNDIGFTTLTTGISINTPDDIVIYPNPAHNQLYIQGTTEKYSAFIYDMTGKVVMSDNTPDNKVELQHLPNGVYVMKIAYNDRVVQKLFVKE